MSAIVGSAFSSFAGTTRITSPALLGPGWRAVDAVSLGPFQGRGTRKQRARGCHGVAHRRLFHIGRDDAYITQA